MSERQEEQRPYLGQRCHIEGRGFGTIIVLKSDTFTREPLARVEVGAGGSQWFKVAELELLATYPAV